jgi:F0F1-type ATP synthase assembly protein I
VFTSALAFHARGHQGLELDVSQRRELNDGMFHRSSGSFELVLAPVLLGLLGFWLDRRLDMVPVFTIVFSVLGIVGAVITTYYSYREGMRSAERRRAEERSGAGLP